MDSFGTCLFFLPQKIFYCSCCRGIDIDTACTIFKTCRVPGRIKTDHIFIRFISCAPGGGCGNEKSTQLSFGSFNNSFCNGIDHGAYDQQKILVNYTSHIGWPCCLFTSLPGTTFSNRYISWHVRGNTLCHLIVTCLPEIHQGYKQKNFDQNLKQRRKDNGSIRLTVLLDHSIK